MEQKLNRVIRACIELGAENPIKSIHDQGAGGNGNVLKEICEPAGAVIKIANFVIGDPTLSTMELWGAEYQENDAVLVAPESRPLIQSICDRERVPIAFVGEVTGDGRVTLVEPAGEAQPQHPFDMALDDVLSKMPKKIFVSDRADATAVTAPLVVPSGETVRSSLDRVLRLLSVGSKRFLTNKVDRSVTGLVAQQQCVGSVLLFSPTCPVHVLACDLRVWPCSNTWGDASPEPRLFLARVLRQWPTATPLPSVPSGLVLSALILPHVSHRCTEVRAHIRPVGGLLGVELQRSHIQANFHHVLTI
jgi:phosphoribosylformylglycinamidine synthase